MLTNAIVTNGLLKLAAFERYPNARSLMCSNRRPWTAKTIYYIRFGTIHYYISKTVIFQLKEIVFISQKTAT